MQKRTAWALETFKNFVRQIFITDIGSNSTRSIWQTTYFDLLYCLIWASHFATEFLSIETWICPKKT